MVVPPDEHENWLSQVRRGLLELCILGLLSQETMYGYQIVKRLESVPGLVTSEGTIYPLLSRLKQQGYLASRLVESPQGPARRNYVLTAGGRQYLQHLSLSWRQIVRAVEGLVP